jgi:hypothetical protein
MFARGLAGGAVGGKVAQSGAEALGANQDQAALAGDVGGLVGGGLSTSKAPRQLVSRALLLGKTPEEAYQSALKPSTTLSDAERATISQTGLNEGIPVSRGGLEKIGGLIDDLNNQVKQTIATDPTRPVNKFAVASRLGKTANKFATQVNPQADLNAVAEAGNEFLANQPNEIPAETAQAMKQGTYRALGDKAYGELKGASIESQKALASGIRQELAQQFPELNNLNAREGSLIELQDALERAVSRISNRDFVGIGTPIAAGAAKAVTGSNKLAAVGAVLKSVLDNPNVKSRLAISLRQGGALPWTVQQRIAGYSGALSQVAGGNQ